MILTTEVTPRYAVFVLLWAFLFFIMRNDVALQLFHTRISIIIYNFLYSLKLKINFVNITRVDVTRIDSGSLFAFIVLAKYFEDKLHIWTKPWR